MSKKNIQLTVAVSLILLLIFVVFSQRYGVLPEKQIIDTTKPTFTLKTPRLAILPPHTHNQGESVEDVGHGVHVRSEVITIPQDVWITSIEPQIENAPYTVMHHLMIEVLDTKDPLCANLNEKIVVVGPDSIKKISIPPPYGIFLKKGTRIRVQGMLHNPEPPLGTGETYYNVTAGFKFSITNTLDSRSKHLDFYLIGLDEPPYCKDDDDYTFTVPPHSAKFIKTSDNEEPNQTYIKFPTDGLLLKMGSHIHGWQGGKRLDVFLNNKLIRSFLPAKLSDSPQIWTSGNTGEPQTIKAGDVLTISTEYENESDTPARGAMGILGVYFSPN